MEHECPVCGPMGHMPSRTVMNTSVQYKIINLLKTRELFIILFCYSSVQFSSMNFVDDNIMPQCQKVRHTYWH